MIFSKLRERIKSMFGQKTIENVLRVNSMVSSEMAEAIQLWSNMYEGKSPWLHEPSFKDPVRINSLGIPAFIASEKARMATLEMKSIITTPESDRTTSDENIHSENAVNINSSADRAEFLNKQYKKLLKQIRRQIEYGIAKGGLVIKPYIVLKSNPINGQSGGNEIIEGQPVNNNSQAAEIEFDFVQADGFYPLAFDATGKMTEAAFIQKKVDKDVIYYRLEHHTLQDTTVIVENTAYKCSNKNNLNSNDFNNLGSPIPLTEVAEWQNIEPITRVKNVDRLLFAYFRMPEANTLDPYSPLGVSGYSRVVKLIQDADMQYSRLLWEFEGGQLAVDVDRDAVRTEYDSEGNLISIPTMLQQRLFRKVDLNTEDTYNVFSPALRDGSLLNGLNAILMRIEDCTGLSRGTLSESSIAEAKTATELKILKQRSFATNADIQMAIEDTLRDVVYIMDVYSTLYNITNPGQYEISFEWDDSIIVDIESELSKRITLMQNGISSKLETRMWYFGETRSQAEAALKQIDEETRADMELQNEMTPLSNEDEFGNEEDESSPLQKQTNKETHQKSATKTRPTDNKSSELISKGNEQKKEKVNK